MSSPAAQPSPPTSSDAHRKAIIESQSPAANALILEIGALDSPTYRREHGYQVRYADYASREELSQKGERNPRYALDRIVDVDYVVNGVDYSEVIHDRFDLIVANHVIEHVPDTITWLHGLGRLLRPGGRVFLSVPDKRFTFDIVRRETNCMDLLRNHIERRTRPGLLDLLDHFWNHKKVNAKDVATGRHHELIKQMRFSPRDALANAARMAELPYADVHCHVFTEASFRQLMLELAGFGFLAYRRQDIFPVRAGTNEFHVLLAEYDEALFKQGLPAAFS